MKLKTSVKYQIFNHFMLVITASLGACSAIAIYYVCIAMKYANEPVNAIMVIDGYDFIFVAIMIISAFYYYKKDLNLCFQLSNSRTGLFISKLIVGIATSAVCSIISAFFCFGINSLCKSVINTSGFHIELRPFFTESMYYKDYHTVYFFGKANNTEKILLGILMMFFAATAVYIISLFIASLFYRVKLIAKVLIVLVPYIIIYAGIPVIDMFVTKGSLAESYNNIIYTMFGMTYKSPLLMCMIFTGIGILFSIGLYYIIKTTQIKR